MRYWYWLCKGETGRSGLERFYNGWLILHVLVGFFLAIAVPLPIYNAADTIIIPLSVVFMGFLCVWLYLQQILHSDKIAKMLEAHPYSYQRYVFVYQTAILLFMIMLTAWGLGDLHVFENLFGRSFFIFIIKVLLYSLTSLTVRECWHLVLGVAKLSLLNMPAKTED